MTTYGYFGPRGTFSQAALASYLESVDTATKLEESKPFSTVPAVLDAVLAGEVDYGMVPIENSVEGGVSATLDALNARDSLFIRAEVLVPITFVLAVRPGTSLADVRAVGSHSHAWPQVRGWMAANAPDAAYVPTLSTAAAAEALGSEAEVPYDAAVCARMAADTFGLEVLAEHIGDNAAAVTRFVLVSGPGRLPEATGADKTTIMLFQHDDHSGGLLELLEQLAARGINMTRLESRPTGAAMGDYCFSIDFEGHVDDARVAETLMSLHRVAARVRFFGSYPRADRRAASVVPSASDTSFADARAWLDDLRQ
ncbi:prephenate dehydratase [Yimella sp. cx-573]|nr:prephenate dehydratase [Yimella sp. cx-573]